MSTLPTLDAHAHLDPRRSSAELVDTGVVLAMSLSLDEAEQAVKRHEPHIAFGVGCHPRKLTAQQAFDPARFAELAAQSPIIGEVGLDFAYQVPFDLQLRTFRAALKFAAGHPRIVSIHSFGTNSVTRTSTCSQVLDELERTPILAPVLHWWTGTAAETDRAVRLGCYFSVHSAVARRSLFRTRVPLDRLLVESDHGWADPPPAIPHRIAWVEYLLSASLKLDVSLIRQQAWHNFAELVRLTSTLAFLPPGLASLLPQETV